MGRSTWCTGGKLGRRHRCAHLVRRFTNGRNLRYCPASPRLFGYLHPDTIGQAASRRVRHLAFAFAVLALAGDEGRISTGSNWSIDSGRINWFRLG